MKKSIGDIFSNPEYLYKALQNTTSEFFEDDTMDFYDQVYPRLLRNILDEAASDEKWWAEQFFREIITKTQEDCFIVLLNSIIFFLLEPAIRKKHFYLYSNKTYELKKLEKCSGIVGVLARLDKNLSSDKIRKDLNKLVAFFKDHGASDLKMRSVIPAKWAQDMTALLHNFFHLWGKILDDKDLAHCIDKYKFIPVKDAVKELLPLPPKVRILPSGNDQVYIFIEDLKFTESNGLFFHEAMYSQVAQLLVDATIYCHCYIDKSFYLSNAGFGIRTLFKNCTFDTFETNNCGFHRLVKFENCKFLRGLYLIQNDYKTALYFDGCTFSKNGEVKIENCNFLKHYPGHFSITNCVFHCAFSLKGCNFYGNFDIHDTSFFNSFDFSDITFNPENVSISNVLFNQGKNVENSKKILVKILRKNKLNQIIKTLGLSSELKENSNANFDYDAYQVAYNSGFLKPEYAAYFLGKSKVYLAKKRTEDKKKLVRDSLPFKIDGRDVQYPVEALLAFKAKDWDTLKNLRKKYPIPTD